MGVRVLPFAPIVQDQSPERVFANPARASAFHRDLLSIETAFPLAARNFMHFLQPQTNDVPEEATMCPQCLQTYRPPGRAIIARASSSSVQNGQRTLTGWIPFVFIWSFTTVASEGNGKMNFDRVLELLCLTDALPFAAVLRSAQARRVSWHSGAHPDPQAVLNGCSSLVTTRSRFSR